MVAPRTLHVLLVAAALGLAPPADAAWRAVCREDVGRFCQPDQEPKTMLECLRAHQSELSALCAKELPPAKAPGSKAATGCGGDVERFCKDLTGRPSAMLQCLDRHKDELSASCRASLARAAAAADTPCAADAKRFCQDVPAQPGARNRCLIEHKAEVSASCRAFLDRPPPPAPACRADIQRLCKDVVGQAEIRKCLLDHESELSPPCKATTRPPAPDPCRPEIVRFCKGVLPGEGRVIACLKEHQSELVEACRKRLEHAPPRKPK